MAVELGEVSVCYPGAPKKAALQGLSMHVAVGELCAIVGPNGAGKSTLLKVLTGIAQLSSGTLRLFGSDASQLSQTERAQRVALVAQRTPPAPGFCVREVVMMGRAPHQGRFMRASAEDDDIVTAALERCALSELAERRVSELSGGEQKRVHIARAFAQQAPLLLLDEAGAHLDIRHSLALYELIKQQCRDVGTTCVAVMHDLNAAAAFGDSCVLLKEGKLLGAGSTDAIMTAERLGAAFEVQLSAGTTAEGRRYFVAGNPHIST